MEEHFETWTNRQTKKVEQIKVIKYFFENWENGIISGERKAGKRLICNNTHTEKEFWYEILNEDELVKIHKKREEIYFEKVENETQKYISTFKQRYEVSEAKKRLLQTEIDLYEKLLFPEKLQISMRSSIVHPLGEIRLPSYELPVKMFDKSGKDYNPDYKGEKVQHYSLQKIDSIAISDIRELYEKIIVNGERNFSLTNSPNCQITIGQGDRLCIRVEAIAKYYNYLKAFPSQQTQTKTETTLTGTEPIIKNTSTEIINTFCKTMDLSIPKDHFKVFTEKESKNKVKYLTVEQLDLFIRRAFCGDSKIPKQKFNQAPKGEKLLIQSVFYEFYNTYCFEYFNTMQCQENFIKILTDNFEGWDFKNVQENFTPKTKKRL